MTDKTGGPAFPLPPSEHMYADAGMTLRDYFAAKAMQGLLSNDQCKPFGVSTSATDIAKKSYLMADEMLRARRK